ncbi:hypothetical protein D3C85_1304460 [compost metagenome]
MALDLPMQVVAFETGEFVFVEHHAVHMARAIGQPTDAMAVRAQRGDALVQFVVFVLPDGRDR